MKWLLDEMLPRAAARELRTRGHDAVSVLDIGLTGSDDSEVYRRAVLEERVMVTENFADYAKLLQERRNQNDRCVPIVFVRKNALPSGGALAVHLARQLDEWASANSRPLPGLYWP